jgi:GNAT superfamily N-acetyltransferase
MFVRLASLEDLTTIKSFDEWNTVDEGRIRAGHCHVAGLERKPLAFGLLDRSFFERQFVAILFVHPDHRRRGLGTAGLGHLGSVATDDKLWISTNLENLPMQRLLHARGYTLSGVVNNLAALPELVYMKVLRTSA